MSPTPELVTQLLDQIAATQPGGGRSAAVSRLFELVYAELRGIAAASMNRHAGGARGVGNTLQPTALVHEAFLKLVGSPAGETSGAMFAGRAHFLVTAAKAMRQILVDHARTTNRDKRGGGWARVTLDQAVAIATGDQFDMLDLDEALRELADLNPRQARLVEARFFGGLSIEEAAEVLEISPATAKTDWRMARAWLSARLAAPEDVGNGDNT